MSPDVLESLQLFSQVCVSIVLEATPFLLLGSLVSGFFEVFVPQERIDKFVPKNPLAGALFGVFLGMLMPCCECGIVALVRRLLAKNVPPPTAVAFMLAGPVINPVVLASTVVAFQGDWTMAWWRMGLVGLMALVVALATRRMKAEDILKPLGAFSSQALFGSLDEALPLTVLNPGLGSRLKAALGHSLGDFLDMGKILVIGAVVAAAFKTWMPEGLVAMFEKDLLMSVLAMMILAVILSLCSQADAFVAASFTGFPGAAKLAFLALGPVLDFKLVLMWSQSFRKDFVRILITLPVTMVFAVCMVLGAAKWVGQ